MSNATFYGGMRETLMYLATITCYRMNHLAFKAMRIAPAVQHDGGSFMLRGSLKGGASRTLREEEGRQLNLTATEIRR